MGKHGTSGTSWPTALDTACTEVDFGTLARAAVPNEISQAVVAIENSLGIQSVWSGAYPVFSDAITAANSSGKTLIISTSVDLPAGNPVSITSPIFFLGSGKINKGSATSLSIGPITGNPMHQIFSGFAAGQVTFSAGSLKIFHPEWVGDNLTLAESFAPSGSTVWLTGGKTYTHTGLWTISKVLNVWGYGASVIFPTHAINQGIRITIESVSIRGLTISGPQWATRGDNSEFYSQRAIHAYGTSYGNPIHTIDIIDCKLNSWVIGINTWYVNNLNILNNTVTDCYETGIGVEAALDFTINNNTVKHIFATGGTAGVTNAWGIYASIKPDGAISKRGTISNNTVEDVPYWHGLDTHGGEDIVFSNNTIRDCNMGICVTDDVVNSLGPKRMVVANNTVLRTRVGDAIVNPGIAVNGSYTLADKSAEDCTITGNTVRGHNIGIDFFDTLNLAVTGNSIRECGVGVEIGRDNENILVSGNTMKHAAGAGVRIEPVSGDTTYGLVEGNAIDSGTAAGVFISEVTLPTPLNFRNNDIKCSVFPYQSDGTLAQYEGDIDFIKELRVSWDPGSIVAGASVEKTNALTGLAGIDGIYATVTTNISLQGLTLQAYVSTNNVSLLLWNATSGAVDLGNATYYIKIFKMATTPY